MVLLLAFWSFTPSISSKKWERDATVTIVFARNQKLLAHPKKGCKMYEIALQLENRVKAELGKLFPEFNWNRYQTARKDLASALLASDRGEDKSKAHSLLANIALSEQ